MTNVVSAGSDKTKRFYDRVGWRKQDGKVVDLHMFGVKEDGPIIGNIFTMFTWNGFVPP